MFVSFARQSIKRIRPGVKTLRGSDVPDWSNASELVISGCSVQPSGTSLSFDGRVLAVNDSMTCFCPANSDIKAGDRIEYDGQTYTIDGEPRKWQSVSGRIDSLQITLERWSG